MPNVSTPTQTPVPAPAPPTATPLHTQTAVVAVHLQVTQDQTDLDVAITHERYGVAIGEPYPALREAFASCDVDPPPDLTRSARLDVAVPRILEGMHVKHGRAVFLEAQLLTLSAEEARELAELLASEPEAVRGELGWMYAEERTDAWRAAAPGRRLKINYLDEPRAACPPQPTEVR
jgi:hypothetical protein